MKRNPFAPTGFGPEDIEVQVSELLVATADSTDEALDGSIGEVLKLLRERMGMDVVFVSEFVEGQRVFRHVSQAPGVNVIAKGQGEPLEQSWCQRVVDGRLPRYMADARADPVASALLDQLPFPVGTHISTPIVLKSGEVYGTLCSFSFSPHDNPNPDDLKTLEMTAKLAALRLEGRNIMPPPRDVPDWDLKPK